MALQNLSQRETRAFKQSNDPLTIADLWLSLPASTKETIDAQSSAWLNEIVSGTGFDLTNARPGDGVALLKTKRAGDPTVDNTPLNGVLRFFWVIIRAVLFLPFNFINVLDEGAHRVAFRIEGRIDISQYPLWAILIGFGEPTSDSKPSCFIAVRTAWT